jgi:hypothetical protein
MGIAMSGSIFHVGLDVDAWLRPFQLSLATHKRRPRGFV